MAPSRWPSWMRKPKALRLVRSKKSPFHIYSIYEVHIIVIDIRDIPECDVEG